MEQETTNNRRSRGTESREFSARSANERPPIEFGAVSRFNLPTSLLKKLDEEGYEAGFVVYSSGGTDQKENYFDAIRRGHEPILCSQYPEIARQYSMSPFGAREEDEISRVGGQTPMKRRKKDAEAERDYYDSERMRQQIMVDTFKQGDSRVLTDQRTRVRY